MFYSLFIISKLFVTIQYFSGLEACGMDIGKRMKELRIQYGLTQQELADIPVHHTDKPLMFPGMIFALMIQWT